MNHRELETRLSELIRQERKITNEILSLINIALERRSYLELGYSSMFDWLVRGYGFSNAAAYRRIEAARMLKAVPTVAQNLSEGTVNLSTLSKAQSIIKLHEKASGLKVTASEKAEVVESILNKSTLQAEQTLIEQFPAAASEVYQERRRVIDEKTIRYQLNLTKEATENLKRAKEILSHKFHNASDADIISYALEQLVKGIDPLKTTKPTSAAEVKSQKGLRLKIISEAQAKCSYRDPVTGRACASTYQIQIDHIRPKAMGGGDEPENLRVLCRQHNLLAAEKAFGKPPMEKYRNPPH